MIIEHLNVKRLSATAGEKRPYKSAFVLDQCYAPDEKTSGMRILFAMVANGSLPISSIRLEYVHDIHDPFDYEIYTKEKFLKVFPYVTALIRNIENHFLDYWMVELKNGTQVEGFWGNGVDVYTESDTVNYAPYMAEIEEKTYHYHPFPLELVEGLMNGEGMNERRAVESLQKLSDEPDLFDEYVRVRRTMRYPKEDKAITVEGYTASSLGDAVGLRLIGRYLMMVTLRRDPKKAKKMIQRGIVRK